jgi:hypothetical protein
MRAIALERQARICSDLKHVIQIKIKDYTTARLPHSFRCFSKTTSNYLAQQNWNGCELKVTSTILLKVSANRSVWDRDFRSKKLDLENLQRISMIFILLFRKREWVCVLGSK